VAVLEKGWGARLEAKKEFEIEKNVGGGLKKEKNMEVRDAHGRKK